MRYTLLFVLTASLWGQGQSVGGSINQAISSSTIQAVSGIDTTSSIASGANRFALPNWRLALGKIQAGTATADAKLLLVGDSTTRGNGCAASGAVIPCSYPFVLDTLMKARSLIAAHGLETCQPSDARWVFAGGGGWVQTAQYAFGGSSINGAGATCGTGTGAGGTFTYTPTTGDTYDSFDVYFMRGNSGGVNFSGGTCTITATGGSPTAQSTTGTAGIGKVTVTAASAATTNAVTVVDTTAGCYIAAIEPFLSTTHKIRVGNAGVGQSHSVGWSNAATFYSIQAIELYAPTLTVVSLGINDATISTSASSFTANIQAIITAAKVSGDVILMSFPPSQNTPQTTYEPQYNTALRSLAAANNIPFIDTYSAWGQSYWTAQMFDAFHPQAGGYWDIASSIDAFLATINN